jgi:hypothetical protein
MVTKAQMAAYRTASDAGDWSGGKSLLLDTTLWSALFALALVIAFVT